MSKLKKYLKFTNLSQYHNKGFKGQGVNVLVLEPTLEGTHDDLSEQAVKLYAPDAYAERMAYNYKLDGEIREKVLNEGFHIVTMSMTANWSVSSPLYKTWKTTMQTWVDAGVKVLESAGNYGYNDLMKSSTKAVAEMLITGAVDETIKRTPYSSWSNEGVVDLCGLVHVKEFIVSGREGKTYFTGTSEACPMVAGTIATGISAGVIETIIPYNRPKTKNIPMLKTMDWMLLNSCVDIETQGKDNQTGHGILILPRLNGNRLAVEMVKPNGRVVYVSRKWVWYNVLKGYKIRE